MKIKKILFFLTFGIFISVAVSNASTYAQTDNCGPYDICPTEIKNQRFTLKKEVKKPNEQNYREKVMVAKGDQIDFRITAENVGDLKTDQMEIVDLLPVELKLISGGKTKSFDNFKVGDKVELKFTAEAQTNIEGDICLANIARLTYQGNTVNSDDATVCIDAGTGQVLGEQLPQTANPFLISMLLPIALIATGYMIVRKSRLT